MKDISIKLTQEVINNECCRINIKSFEKDIHGRPGLYIEFQEGCGYNYKELTIEEAERVIKALKKVVDYVKKEFDK